MDSFRVKAKPSIFSRGGSANANRFRPKIEEKAIYENESLDNSFFSAEYREKDSILSFDLLKKIAIKVAPISAIIGTRIDQIGSFTTQSRYKENNLGFKVKVRDIGEEPSEEMEQRALDIETFIAQCGREKDKRRDNFDTFIRKIMRDSLTYDQVNFEIVRDVNGKPVEFMAVDASTIRAATEEYTPDEKLGELKDDEEVSFVQVVEDKIVAWFTDEELAFSVRNPRADVEIQPYGLSEIETIVNQLSSYLEAEEYNMRFFQQGGMTKGILNIKEDPNGIAGQRGLESFKRQWRTQVSGQNGAWKIPVFQLPGQLEFINIAQSGGEMVFEQWMNYLINICCAVYRIDPAEINFPNNGGAGGNGGGLFEGSNESKYKQSRSKGLKPLLQFIENTMNRYIVSEFGDDYVFTFEGLDETTEQERLQIDQNKVGSYMLVNELRAEKGLEDIEGGDIILNPYYMQNLQATGGGGGMDGFDFGGEGDGEGFDFEDEGNAQSNAQDEDDPTEEAQSTANANAQESAQEDVYEDTEKSILIIERI